MYIRIKICKSLWFYCGLECFKENSFNSDSFEHISIFVGFFLFEFTETITIAIKMSEKTITFQQYAELTSERYEY